MIYPVPQQPTALTTQALTFHLLPSFAWTYLVCPNTIVPIRHVDMMSK